MSIANLAALNALLYGGSQRVPYHKSATYVVIATGGPQLNSNWVDGPFVGSVPAAAAICDRTTVGGLHSYGWQNKIGTEQRLWLDRFDIAYTASMGSGILMLVDRLAHVGGLDATLTTAQSNGAWPALTRSTNGLGVWAAAEIYTTVGATGTTLTMNYTNDANTAGQVSQPTDFGASGLNAARRLMPINLANGDKGVRAIASATLAASTGTAGAWGLTLFKTLGMWMSNGSSLPISHSGKPFPNFGSMPVIPDNACLQLLAITGINAASIPTSAVIRAFED